MAHRLCESLCALGIETSINNEWIPEADVNHFMIFHFVAGKRSTRNTMLITHVDDPLKVRMIKDHLRDTVDVGICMSRMSVADLVAQGVARESLCFVSPAHDGGIASRRICIGITSNLYSDGRKREHLLARLAAETDLSSFHFEIFGKGWGKTVAQLKAGGATVRLEEGTTDCIADYAEIQRSVPLFDYYLYPGLDEGSLGTLDALSAGVKTIVTPQGFHLDIHGGITHPFLTYEELRSVFAQLAVDRHARIASVSGWTWEAYARQHVKIWGALLSDRRADVPRILGQESMEQHPAAAIEKIRLAQPPARRRFLSLLNSYRWNMVKGYYLPKIHRRYKRALSRIRANLIHK